MLITNPAQMAALLPKDPRQLANRNLPKLAGASLYGYGFYKPPNSNPHYKRPAVARVDCRFTVEARMLEYDRPLIAQQDQQGKPPA